MFPHAKLCDPAYLVTKAHHKLYDATSAATLTLTGTKPSVAFRCSVYVTSATGHADCIGSITVGSETSLTFTTSGQRKTTTTNLTALPVITVANMDCHILIEAIDSGGAFIEDETLTAIDIKYKDETKYFSSSIGDFVTRPAHCTTDETASQVGDIIRYSGVDHVIKAIHPTDGRDGLEIKRKLEF